MLNQTGCRLEFGFSSFNRIKTDLFCFYERLDLHAQVIIFLFSFLIALQNDKESQELCENIGKLMSMIPKSTPERLNFILTALKLKPTILPIYSIHQQFAMITWKEKDFSDSRYHFLHCLPSCSEECANMLIDFQTSRGYPSEVDLFPAQFILQLLCLKKVNFDPSKENLSLNVERASSSSLSDDLNLSKITPKSSQHAFANLTLQVYVARHPLIKASNPPFFQPLLNFLWFLLLAIEGLVKRIELSLKESQE